MFIAEQAKPQRLKACSENRQNPIFVGSIRIGLGVYQCEHKYANA